MRRRLTVLAALALFATGLLMFSAACKKKPPKTAEEGRPPVTSAAPPSTAVAPPVTPGPRRDVEAEVLVLEIDELNRRGYLSDAFFDYDQYDLREDARSALAGDAEWLKKYPSIQVLIEGHCDERGTEAYNLALGDRRANAAKEYLTSLGIAGSRVRTVSYGKERPFCADSTESCWQQNRRSHFVITSK